MIYYFAYGSNMDQRQMTERCPDSVLVGKAVLKDYKLAFTIYSPTRKCGCADIVKSSVNEVWGLVYALTPEDLKKLDRCECHPQHYRRTSVSVIGMSGELINAETYEVVNKKVEYQMPSRDYMNIILNACDIFDFDQSYKATINQFEIKDESKCLRFI